MKRRDKPSTIKAIENSRTKKEAVDKLGISRQALDQWLRWQGLVVVKDTRLKVKEGSRKAQKLYRQRLRERLRTKNETT